MVIVRKMPLAQTAAAQYKRYITQNVLLTIRKHHINAISCFVRFYDITSPFLNDLNRFTTKLG